MRCQDININNKMWHGHWETPFERVTTLPTYRGRTDTVEKFHYKWMNWPLPVLLLLKTGQLVQWKREGEYNFVGIDIAASRLHYDYSPTYMVIVNALTMFALSQCIELASSLNTCMDISIERPNNFIKVSTCIPINSQ